MGKEIFIMAEQRGGWVEEPSFSLLSEARRLRQRFGGLSRLSAILMGHGIEDPCKDLGLYGADQVYVFDHPCLNRYEPEIYTDLVAELLREKQADLFLLGATSLGSDLAPRVAARLRAGLVTQCVDLLVNQDRLEVIKPVSGEYLYQRIVFNKGGLGIVTLSLHAMAKEDPLETTEPVLVRITPEIDPRETKVRFLEFIKADPGTIGLEEADRIVCGGRGAGRKAFGIISELADALEASVGGTRPVVDWGLLPQERQIGQTGVDVSPTVLIACGVSGANELTAGIEGSKFVIAINTDRRARIFKFADLGIVGDLHEIIPLVMERVKKFRGKT